MVSLALLPEQHAPLLGRSHDEMGRVVGRRQREGEEAGNERTATDSFWRRQAAVDREELGLAEKSSRRFLWRGGIQIIEDLLHGEAALGQQAVE